MRVEAASVAGIVVSSSGDEAELMRNEKFRIYIDGKYVCEATPEKLNNGSIFGLNILDFDVSKLTAPGNLPRGIELRAASADWSVPSERTPFILHTAEAPAALYAFPLLSGGSGGISVTSGLPYVFAADLGFNRCGGGLRIEWRDEHGIMLDSSEHWREDGRPGGRSSRNYDRLIIQAAAPPKASVAYLFILKGPTTAESDSILFFRRPFFCQAPKFPIFDVTFKKIRKISKKALAGARDGASSEYFRLPLSISSPLKGKLHIEVHGQEIAYEGEYVAPTPIQIETLEIQGEGVAGSFRMEESRYLIGDGVLVSVDGDLCGKADIHPRGKDVYAFSFHLGKKFFDGCDHLISLHDTSSGNLIYELIEYFPPFLTPTEALQRYTPRISKYGLNPLAAHRYQGAINSLQTLARMGKNIPDGLMDDICRCHEVVVNGPKDAANSFQKINFPSVREPKYSIIIPVHNKFYFTYFCLAAVLYTSWNKEIEVVVVDDGSKDETINIGEYVDGIKTVRHPSALGFVRSCNDGAEAASGEYLIFLNNDTEVLAGWLDELRFGFDVFDKVGMTGSKLIYPDGRLQEAGGVVWSNGQPWNLGRDGNANDPAYCYTRRADYLSGAAVMIARPVWEIVGGFSREFEPAYYEDTDLAFKVRKAGFKTLLTPQSVVVHYEGVSNGTSTSSGMKRFQEINRPKFEAKWRSEYRYHGRVGDRPDLEKDRGCVGRCLVVDNQVPRYDYDAGSYAISQEIRMLQALGYKVTLVVANSAYLGVYTETFERAGVEVTYAPFTSSIEDFLERRGREFDIVYLHRYGLAESCIDAVRRHAPNAMALLNCGDLHFLREARRARVLKDEAAFAQSLITREREFLTFQRVDHVLTYSNVEASILESCLLPHQNVFVTPWVVEAHQPDLLEGRSGISFLGSYDHPPNREAVDFFARECLPSVRRNFPGTSFNVYGSGFVARPDLSVTDGVEYRGWVSSLEDVFQRSRIFVAPLRSGAGIKGKVLDAMSFGCPLVATSVAAEGIGLVHGENAFIADDPQEFSRYVAQLIGDDELWMKFSTASLEHLEKKFSFKSGIERFREIFATLKMPHFQTNKEMQSEALYPLLSLSDIGFLNAS